MRIADSGRKPWHIGRANSVGAAVAGPGCVCRRSEGILPYRSGLRGMARLAFTGVLLLSLGTTGWGQAHDQAKVAGDSKEDVKQAQQLADRADKAFAAGRMNEALAEYQQAVKRAPGAAGIDRGA